LGVGVYSNPAFGEGYDFRGENCTLKKQIKLNNTKLEHWFFLSEKLEPRFYPICYLFERSFFFFRKWIYCGLPYSLIAG